MEESLEISTSVIEYLGKQNNGVSIAVALTIYDYSFESVYWIHPDGWHTLECDTNFLKLFGVQETEDLPFLHDLVEEIESVLPEKEEIFKEFL
jgi:predicted heme/steroid binding protein